MAAHTPGPWTWDYNTLRGPDGAVVFDVSTNPCGPHLEDARLIAAAPDLLEACRLVLRWHLHDQSMEGLAIVSADVHAAIAKAEPDCDLKPMS